MRDRLSFGIGRDGRWRIRGEFGIDDGRRIEAALTERRDALFTEQTNNVGDDDRAELDGDADTDTGRGDAGDGQVVTWPEAFLDCMERSLDQVESSSRRDRYRAWLHLDIGSGDATTTDGWRIPMAIRDRLLCDGVVQPVWETEGLPFSIGRAQHIVPDRTRRIIEKRDRGCRVPGCTAERFVEIHHIIHWTDGGPTDTWNLISLCPAHHRMHHAGGLGITGNADEFDGIAFSDIRGDPIPGTGTPVLPIESPPAPPVPYDPPLRGRFDWNWIGLGWAHPDTQARRLTDVDAARPEAA